MPNRMLRDWTQSEKIDELTSESERFFTRLIMKVDDYGCFWADTRLLKANLFPLKLDKIREADMLRWMAECQKAGLIVLYEVNQKKYLQIIDFRQRLDRAKAKFPLPTGEDPLTTGKNDFPEIVNDFPPETEVEVEKKKKGIIGEKSAPPPTAQVDFEKREETFYQSLKPYLSSYGKDLLRKFFDYWREPNKSRTKMRWEQEKTWDLNLRLQRWASSEFNKTEANQKPVSTVNKKLSEAVKKIENEHQNN